jgi:hypothetical protein
LIQLYHTIEADALAATWKHRRKLRAYLNTDHPGLRNFIKRPLSKTTKLSPFRRCASG